MKGGYTTRKKLVTKVDAFFYKGARVVDQILEKEWDQPYIDQPEIGLLGLFGVHIEDKIRFALQMKVEPGNRGGTQLSPTVQATKSNQKGVHGGRKVRYLDIFLDRKEEIKII